MKKRTGFVSNSSSSSFIVAFPCMIETLPIQSLRELMFPGIETLYHPYTGRIYSAEQIAQAVMDDAKFGEAFENEMLNRLRAGSVIGKPDMDFPKGFQHWTREQKDMFWEELEDMVFEWAVNILTKFKLANKGRHFYIFRYSDDYEFGQMMEHGDVFRNVPHLHISEH